MDTPKDMVVLILDFFYTDYPLFDSHFPEP